MPPAETLNRTRADTEAMRLYAALKHEILANRLQQGQPLAEVELARRLGASRTPLREALLRLEADGLVRIEPRRGAFVHQLTVADFLEINELRSVLEPYAARLATLRIDAHTIQALQTRLAAIPPSHPDEAGSRRLEELDADVHRALATASGNKRMAKLIQGLDDMMEVMRVDDMRRRHQELRESLAAILDALAARDPDRVEVLFRRHISDFSGAIVNQEAYGR
jgi:DNA-binding GntR family transcriptional regulator